MISWIGDWSFWLSVFLLGWLCAPPAVCAALLFFPPICSRSPPLLCGQIQPGTQKIIFRFDLGMCRQGSSVGWWPLQTVSLPFSGYHACCLVGGILFTILAFNWLKLSLWRCYMIALACISVIDAIMNFFRPSYETLALSTGVIIVAGGIWTIWTRTCWSYRRLCFCTVVMVKFIDQFVPLIDATATTVVLVLAAVLEICNTAWIYHRLLIVPTIQVATDLSAISNDHHYEFAIATAIIILFAFILCIFLVKSSSQTMVIDTLTKKKVVIRVGMRPTISDVQGAVSTAEGVPLDQIHLLVRCKKSQEFLHLAAHDLVPPDVQCYFVLALRAGSGHGPGASGRGSGASISQASTVLPLSSSRSAGDAAAATEPQLDASAHDAGVGVPLQRQCRSCRNNAAPDRKKCQECLDKDAAKHSESTDDPKTAEQIREHRERKEREAKLLHDNGVIATAEAGLRFCSRCGSRARPVEEFDGSNVVCRKHLQQLRAARRAKADSTTVSDIQPTRASASTQSGPAGSTSSAAAAGSSGSSDRDVVQTHEFASEEAAENFISLLGQQEGVMYNHHSSSTTYVRKVCHCHGKPGTTRCCQFRCYTFFSSFAS